MAEQQQTEAQPAAAGAETPAGGEMDLERARAEIEGLRTELRERQLRGLAELDNVRKRAEREIATSARYGAEKLLADLLTVVDSLELGQKAAAAAEASVGSLVEGLELTHRQFAGVLEKHGVTLIDPLGRPFDPELHEAVATIEQPQAAANQVVEVLQKGYRLHDRLLRPARVVVARAPKAG